MQVFIIDTNVLLYDPHSILKFGKSIVFVPLVCIEELDNFKKEQNENGRNAREFSRVVDKLRGEGSLAKGVPLENGGKLIIGSLPLIDEKLLKGLQLHNNDNQILGSALAFKKEKKKTTLISKDINLRLKADCLEILAEDYKDQNVKFEDLYLDTNAFDTSSEKMQEFEKKQFILAPEENQFYPNEYLVMRDKNNANYRHHVRYHFKDKTLKALKKFREGIWGIYPKNVEQQCALDALMDETLRFVGLAGKAGTGKTLLAMACGLELVLNQEKYKKVLVTRPIMPLGRDLGYLPGDVHEKLAPWMQPVFDILDFLFGQHGAHEGTWVELQERGLLVIEPLTYIRGRSISSQYIIVDEAQNLSPHEIKTVVTRAGNGSKIILTGDCEQIDNPYLDSVNNGLFYSMNRLRSEEIVASIILKQGERSPLSEVASKLL